MLVRCEDPILRLVQLAKACLTGWDQIFLILEKRIATFNRQLFILLVNSDSASCSTWKLDLLSSVLFCSIVPSRHHQCDAYIYIIWHYYYYYYYADSDYEAWQNVIQSTNFPFFFKWMESVRLVTSEKN